MKRRHLLATTGLLAAPRLATAQAARVLRFVPQADLSGMDPVVTTRQVVRNGALLLAYAAAGSFAAWRATRPRRDGG